MFAFHSLQSSLLIYVSPAFVQATPWWIYRLSDLMWVSEGWQVALPQCTEWRYLSSWLTWDCLTTENIERFSAFEYDGSMFWIFWSLRRPPPPPPPPPSENRDVWFLPVMEKTKYEIVHKMSSNSSLLVSGRVSLHATIQKHWNSKKAEAIQEISKGHSTDWISGFLWLILDTCAAQSNWLHAGNFIRWSGNPDVAYTNSHASSAWQQINGQSTGGSNSAHIWLLSLSSVQLGSTVAWIFSWKQFKYERNSTSRSDSPQDCRNQVTRRFENTIERWIIHQDLSSSEVFEFRNKTWTMVAKHLQVTPRAGFLHLTRILRICSFVFR